MIGKLLNFIKSDTFRKLFKFGCIGLLNTAVDYGTFSLLFYIVGVDKLISQGLAVLTAATNSYLLNNNITFKKEKQNGLLAYCKFMSVNLISVALSVFLMRIFTENSGLEPMLAKIPISLITICLSFTVYNKFIFKNRR